MLQFNVDLKTDFINHLITIFSGQFTKELGQAEPGNVLAMTQAFQAKIKSLSEDKMIPEKYQTYFAHLQTAVNLVEENTIFLANEVEPKLAKASEKTKQLAKSFILAKDQLARLIPASVKFNEAAFDATLRNLVQAIENLRAAKKALIEAFKLDDQGPGKGPEPRMNYNLVENDDFRARKRAQEIAR
ncbi:MAG: hypothetical protein AB7V32_01140, partial [Candidatus Berkiella sp.]